jgi:alpha-aminoadipic semialdehyde synthase
MKGCVGIRREDKNRWEARAPLTPQDVERLGREHGIRFVVQPAPVRAFPDDDYRGSGATIGEDLSDCNAILAVKEIPKHLFHPGGAYVFFSHTIKAQPYNMAMLGRLMELGCTLIDYELIVDGEGRRTVFFGVHAGLAGMVETLVALGQRLVAEGIENPFTTLRQPVEYDGLDAVKEAVSAVGERIASDGMPPGCAPFVFGLAGYGNVSAGAQEILDLLPVIEVQPRDLPGLAGGSGVSDRHVYKVVFHEEHMVEPLRGDFDLQEYYDHPERYRGTFHRHLPHLDVLVNCIFWTDRYPRLVTREQAVTLERLRVIGDISCDIEGGIEFTVKATLPDVPCFTFDPATGTVTDGVQARGIVVMSVDNLPCELPREATRSFSTALADLVPALAGADWSRPVDELGLPRALRDAIILHRGRLVPGYADLEQVVKNTERR